LSKESEVNQSVPPLAREMAALTGRPVEYYWQQKPIFDHKESLKDPGYAAGYDEYVQRAKKRLQLVGLVVVTENNDYTGEGMVFGNRLNEPGVKERVGEQLEKLANALKNEEALGVYEAFVNIHGLRIGGSHYPERGVNVYSVITPSEPYQIIIDNCRELIGRFSLTDGPVEPLSGLVAKPILDGESIEISPSDVEVELFCGLIIEKLAEVQRDRIDYKDGIKGKLLGLRIGNFPLGKDAFILDVSKGVLQQLPLLRGPRERVSLLKCFRQIYEISSKFFLSEII